MEEEGDTKKGGDFDIFCRCRPLESDEKSGLGFDSSQVRVMSSTFEFDHVFSPGDNQDAVFEKIKPVLLSVLEGGNVCVFAYGSSGSGKTYTMEGSPNNRGLYYRTLEELFQRIEEKTPSCEISVSMLEVYNEMIRDLLVDNSNKLDIELGEVPGLASVCGKEEALKLIEFGAKARSVKVTKENYQSSRSHSLLRVTVRTEAGENNLWLVDLASITDVKQDLLPEDERPYGYDFFRWELEREEMKNILMKESRFINKSLGALCEAILALASQSKYFPYKDSKLSHLLQSSLGRDSKSLILMHVRSDAEHVEQTTESLMFSKQVCDRKHSNAEIDGELTANPYPDPGPDLQPNFDYEWSYVGRLLNGEEILPTPQTQIGPTCILVAAVGCLEAQHRMIHHLTNQPGLFPKLSVKHLFDSMDKEDINSIDKVLEKLMHQGVMTEESYNEQGYELGRKVYKFSRYEEVIGQCTDEDYKQICRQIMYRGPVLGTFDLKIPSKSVPGELTYIYDKRGVPLKHVIMLDGFGEEDGVCKWNFQDSASNVEPRGRIDRDQIVLYHLPMVKTGEPYDGKSLFVYNSNVTKEPLDQ